MSINESCYYCDYCNYCDYCYSCYSCDYCYSCYSCYYCDYCNYCDYCYSCKNLVNGFMCINLKLDKKDDTKYWIFNKEVSEEEWDNRFNIGNNIKESIINNQKEATNK